MQLKQLNPILNNLNLYNKAHKNKIVEYYNVMTYYLMPKSINIDIKNIISISLEESSPDYCINLSLRNYLKDIKLEIDNQDSWDNMKKYTNPYEYIHTIVPGYKTSICKYKPLSRSYFKMIEIIKSLYLLDDFVDHNIKTFHIAEGPGGFIEATNMMRNNKNDIYYGMTLIDNADYVPGWKKSRDFLNNNPHVNIEYGIDKTGNIFNLVNLDYCYNKYKNSMNFITGDGGFDFSSDFLNQEISATNLILTQIIYALLMQKKNGHFVIKFFDMFTRPSIEMIYLLNLFYNKVYLLKPNTSRYANSERYVICKNFKYSNTNFLYDKFYSILENINNNPEKKINSILNVNVPYIYFTKIEEYNAILGQQQIEIIKQTIQLINSEGYIKSEKIENYKKNNIFRCIQWCIKNKHIYYKNINSSNIFLFNN